MATTITCDACGGEVRDVPLRPRLTVSWDQNTHVQEVIDLCVECAYRVRGWFTEGTVKDHILREVIRK